RARTTRTSSNDLAKEDPKTICCSYVAGSAKAHERLLQSGGQVVCSILDGVSTDAKIWEEVLEILDREEPAHEAQASGSSRTTSRACAEECNSATCSKNSKAARSTFSPASTRNRVTFSSPSSTTGRTLATQALPSPSTNKVRASILSKSMLSATTPNALRVILSESLAA
ncbi:unnamed protein product, partial [Amoebophrya sp. A25]